MYPGRFWAALGTGEASNEHITGDGLAAEGRAQRPAGRVRRRHPGAPPGRGGEPRRPGDGRPGPGVDPARRARAAARRRRLAGDGAVGGRLGRRADHRRPAPRRPPAGRRRLPGRAAAAGRSSLQVHLSLGARRRHGVGDRPRPVAHATSSRLRCAGTSRRSEVFDEAARHVTPEDVAGSVFTTSDLGRHAAHLHELVDLGFDRVFLAPRRAGAATVPRRLRRRGPARAGVTAP